MPATPLDPYEQQEVIEQVSDRLIDDEPAEAIFLIASKYDIDLLGLAEQDNL